MESVYLGFFQLPSDGWELLPPQALTLDISELSLGSCIFFFPFSFSKSLCFLLGSCPLPGQGFWLSESYSWLSLQEPFPPPLASFPRTGSGLPGRSLSASVFPFGIFSLLKAHLETLRQHSTSASSSKQGTIIPWLHGSTHPVIPSTRVCHRIIEYPRLERTHKDQQVQLSAPGRTT